MTDVTATAPGVAALAATVRHRFDRSVSLIQPGDGAELEVRVDRGSVLPDVCGFLASEARCLFGGLVVEERRDHWKLFYPFLSEDGRWLQVTLTMALETRTLPSITPRVHAADWYEREAEDLFGLRFELHPRLGDFVLHDQVWQEGVEPMRRAFDAQSLEFERRPQAEWRPTLVVRDPGAFAMPVGPIYEGGIAESAHFLLETVGEDVVRAVPRLFYNYRAVEKIAEGRTIAEGLLLAERFAATSAFAHSLAYCEAVEGITGAEVPARARVLRVMLAELERMRHHAGTITAICQSTALVVSDAQAALVEESLLRASCMLSGHRYLFGLNAPGGLCRDFDAHDCSALVSAVDAAAAWLRRLEQRLRYTSSFLDRLEDVGVITSDQRADLGLVGPVARASGSLRDMRRDAPYAAYASCPFDVPTESEGDGYARLRVLFREALQSADLIRQVVLRLTPGPVRADLPAHEGGAALVGIEAPIGAGLHWVRLDHEGRLVRYHAMTASFRNWLGLHVAAENFAFQDFPIILATLGLSMSECDR